MDLERPVRIDQGYIGIYSAPSVLLGNHRSFSSPPSLIYTLILLTSLPTGGAGWGVLAEVELQRERERDGYALSVPACRWRGYADGRGEELDDMEEGKALTKHTAVVCGDTCWFSTSRGGEWRTSVVKVMVVGAGWGTLNGAASAATGLHADVDGREHTHPAATRGTGSTGAGAGDKGFHWRKKRKALEGHICMMHDLTQSDGLTGAPVTLLTPGYDITEHRVQEMSVATARQIDSSLWRWTWFTVTPCMLVKIPHAYFSS
ncbi:hypothetical protein JB92DRAFT_2826061 [Gautieria morchelliformis]|nr:hypothetical protein JB92DRAFT_2826061 [Gautieria morchelliformis]